MRPVNIMNKEVLRILEEFRYTFFEKYDITKTNTHLEGDDPSYFCSKEYLNKIISIGREHDGFPETANSYCIKPDHYEGKDRISYREEYNRLDNQLKIELGLHRSALSQLYPPDGFISWHTNENASSYNLLFTWNETGDGYFEYLDPQTKELVRVQDKKGWSCKAGYFGSSEEPDKIVYHCASTKSWRITLSYILGHNDDYWNGVIEQINTL